MSPSRGSTCCTTSDRTSRAHYTEGDQMLTRQAFEKRFGRRAVFGMIHLKALPGAPVFGGSIDAVIEAAVADARALIDGGCDGFAIENFGDRPFAKDRVSAETIAAMARVITEVRRAVDVPF